MKISIVYATVVAGLSGVLSLSAQNPPRPATPAPLYGLWAGSPAGGSFLGVGVAEVTSERARALNLKEEYGVEVTRVDEDSPAEKAGLKAGDVVLEYNGQRVEGIEQFQRLVRETPAGRTVKLLVSRNGSTQTLAANLGMRKSKLYPGNVKELFGPDSLEFPNVQIPDMPQVFTTWRNSTLGVEAEPLGSQLAAYFGVKEGVLVRSVVKGSAAGKAGIKAGDVITKVDQTKVTSPAEVASAVRAARSKKSFPLELVRDRHEMSINVTIDEDRSERILVPRATAMRGGGVKL